MREYKKEKGITLIALVVTIIVLLILASISIGILTGDTGILKNSQEAKENTEIAEEKEILNTSVAQAVGDDTLGNIQRDALQNKLDDNTETGKTNTIDCGDNIVVEFVETNRYYEVDKDGNVNGPKEMVEDNYSGDITKGGKQDGSEEKPFQVNCIEDLVALSIMSNGGNEDLELSWYRFSGQYIELTRTLDFKSIFSYDDYATQKYGDLNSDGTVEGIRDELTKIGEGCTGFTPIGLSSINSSHTFLGTFDGKGQEIRNIYQNFTNQGNINAALFGRANNGEIKNLNVTGEVINASGIAAGIVAEGNSKVTNCTNYANITGYNMVGGIIAHAENNLVANNCFNYGNITIIGKSSDYGGAGGIIGVAMHTTIQNCTNKGKIIGEMVNLGGIVGCTQLSGSGTTCYIDSCINIGEARAGILGLTRGEIVHIVNCYNAGYCTNGIVTEFSGAAWYTEIQLNIKNTYNLGTVENSGILGTQGNICKTITLTIENCYNAGNTNIAIIGRILTNADTTTITNISNTYYDQEKIPNIGATSEGITSLSIKNNTSFIETLNNNIGDNSNWKHWKIGEDGYPCFE